MPPSSSRAERRVLCFDSSALRLVFAAVVVVLFTVAAVPVLNATVYSPGRTVAAYLHAVESGNAAQALGMLVAPPARVSTALTQPTLENAPALPSAGRILDEQVDGDRATVRAGFNLGESSHEEEFALVRAGHTWGLFDRWLITVEEWPRIALDVTGPASVEINGLSAPADQGAVPVLFPVGYTAGFDARYLRSEFSRVDLVTPGQVAEVRLQPQPTDVLRGHVQQQVNDQLDACAQATTLMPAGCTFGYETNHQILGDVDWSVVSYPVVSLTTEGAQLTVAPTEAVVEVSGRSRDIVTAYESDFTEQLRIRITAAVLVENSSVTVVPEPAGPSLGESPAE